VRIVLLNSLPLNAFKRDVTIYAKPISLETMLSEIAEKRIQFNAEVVSYIRHPATIELLNKYLQRIGVKLEPNTGLYVFHESDDIYVVILKKPIRGQEATEIAEKDIVVWNVIALYGNYLP